MKPAEDPRSGRSLNKNLNHQPEEFADREEMDYSEDDENLE